MAAKNIVPVRGAQKRKTQKRLPKQKTPSAADKAQDNKRAEISAEQPAPAEPAAEAQTVEDLTAVDPAVGERTSEEPAAGDQATLDKAAGSLREKKQSEARAGARNFSGRSKSGQNNSGQNNSGKKSLPPMSGSRLGDQLRVKALKAPPARRDAARQFSRAALRHGPTALRTLVALMKAAPAPMVRLLAARAILDRAYGRPPASEAVRLGAAMEGNGNFNTATALAADPAFNEARAVLEALAEERAGRLSRAESMAVDRAGEPIDAAGEVADLDHPRGSGLGEDTGRG